MGHDLLNGNKSLVADRRILALNHVAHHSRLGSQCLKGVLAAGVVADVLTNVMRCYGDDLCV